MVKKMTIEETGDKKGTGYFGEIISKKQQEITLLGRKIIVWIYEYKSGLQKCGAFFVDKNLNYLRVNNLELRKRIKELEDKLGEKK